MREIEAVSGVFVDEQKKQVLLFQRNEHRTYGKNTWDLMGGDILLDETPAEALRRDAWYKLHVSNIIVVNTTEVKSEETDAVINRHVFICYGDYERMLLDQSKYSRTKWVPWDKIDNKELTPHALHVLTFIKNNLDFSLELP